MHCFTTRQDQIIRRIGVAGALALFVFILYRFFAVRLDHDQASYLFEAQRLLGGAEPYGPHLSETNPPLIIWFSALPVLLGNWLHASPILLFRLMVMAMIAGSVAWSLRLYRRSSTITAPAAIALLSFATLAAEFSIGLYPFGQREHLLIILILPYVIAVATGVVNRLSVVERCTLGLLAGMAIWFKPQDALILVALEIFVALRLRSLRRFFSPEFLALLLTSLVIFALVLLCAPLYLKQIYPLLLDVYWALGTSTTLRLALSLYGYMLCIAAILLACYLLRRNLRDIPTTLALIICSVAASLAYDVQHTTWPYHAYPHRTLIFLALAYLLIDLAYPFLEELPANKHRITPFVLTAFALTAIMLFEVSRHPQVAGYIRKGTPPHPLETFFSQYQPPTTVYVFSTSVPPLSIAYQHGLNWGSRFAHMWMMPAIIQNETGPISPTAPFKRLPPKTLARLEALQRSQSTEDLNYWHPSVVLVQQCTAEDSCQGLDGKNFDMLTWLKQSPDFTAAWSHYQRQPGIQGYDVYKLAR
jgi:hypothetical protein